jgi:hypothetical protein
MAHTKALEKQNHAANINTFTKILDKAAVKIEDEPHAELKPIAKLYRFDTTDLKTANEIVQTASSGAEVVYRQDNNGAIYVYQKGGFADELTETEIQERRVKQENDERMFRLEKVLKQAYELRIKYVKSITVTPEIKKTVEAFAAKILLTRTHEPQDYVIRNLLDIKGPLEKKSISAIIKKHNSETMLLRAVYAALEPGATQDDRVKQAYEFLDSLGYIMSEEETQLADGTHPLAA